MIFSGLIACESRHRQKLTAREVNAPPLGKVAPAFLKWSKTAITLDGWQERFPLVVDPIISKTRLSRVLMDGRSALNLLYAETYDAMGLS
jgi:hypothetical protein